MAEDTESRRWRAKQMGMLMRAYRRSYRMQGRDGRLSQSGLLDLMGRVDERYSELHGHSTVARWESGTTRPTRDRIEVFGQALNLSPAVIEGLMRLAGFKRESAYPTRTQRLEESADTGATSSAEIYDIDGGEEEWDPYHRFDVRYETFTIRQDDSDRLPERRRLHWYPRPSQ